MTEKEQVGTYIRKDLLDLVQAEDRPNTEVFNDALAFYFEAHGKGSAEQIEKELAEVRDQRESFQEEMLAKIAELEDRESELEAALEKKQELKQSRERLQRQILGDMEANPAKNLLAYSSEIQELLAHPDGASTREEVLANLRGLASEYDVNISRLKENAGGPAVAADGDGAGDEEIDPDKYDFDDGGDS